MHMTDILPVAAWAALEQEILEKFQINAHAYTETGAPFTGHPPFGNRFCPALRQHKTAAGTICAGVNQALGLEVRQSGQPVVTDCDAGLMVVCVPVVVDGAMVGMVGGCGAIVDDAEPETFLIEKTSGITEDQVAELCSDMPRFSGAEAQEISDYIAARVAEILKDYTARQA
jgi:ligand-binding sensor protein